MGEGGRFLEELRKRGVVRAGLLYAACAFALLEFADIAFPRLGLPDGAVNIVLWLGLAGFPLALLASWAIDIRAQRDRGQTRSWLSPATLAASAILIELTPLESKPKSDSARRAGILLLARGDAQSSDLLLPSETFRELSAASLNLELEKETFEGVPSRLFPRKQCVRL